MDIIAATLIETDGNIFLRGQPNAARPSVDATTLHELLKHSSFSSCAYDETAIATAVEACNTAVAPFAIQIAQRQNAKVEITITSDDMLAELTVTPPRGGNAITLPSLQQALAEFGVTFGIDQQALERACAAGACSHLPIAHGKLPENGTDSSFEELVDQTSNRVPQVNADGLIDYREHSNITVVHAGMPLMRRTPATPGTNGSTVRGKLLPARGGHDEPYAAQDLLGTEVSKNDPNILVAAVSGQAVRVKSGMQVEPVLQLNDVNMATGNIHFDGTVNIKGDVLQDMRVQASGDIVVGGMIDGGLLEAGGNINVTGGIIAGAILQAQGAISALFAQGVELHAGSVIALHDMALECKLYSGNSIIIGSEKPGHGRLIAGSATAMMRIQVPVLGSGKSAVTKITLGENPELTERFTSLLKQIAKEKESESHLDKLFKQVVAAGDPRGMLPRIKASRQHAIQVWGQLLAKRKAMEEEMARMLQAKLEIGSSISGAVDLILGPKRIRLRRDFNAGTFALDEAQNLVYTPLNGKPQVMEC